MKELETEPDTKQKHYVETESSAQEQEVSKGAGLPQKKWLQSQPDGKDAEQTINEEAVALPCSSSSFHHLGF